METEQKVWEGWANIYDERSNSSFDMCLFFYKDNLELAQSKLGDKKNTMNPIGGRSRRVRVEILE